MINVNKILTKNKWSGKDVGMLKIANKMDFRRRANAGDYSADPMILPADFDYMISTLNEKEKNILSGYADLCEWVDNNERGASSMAQLALARFLWLNSWLEKSIIVENALTYTERLPVIMTQEQYEEEIRKNILFTMTDKQDGSDYVFSLKDLILYAANTMLKDLKANPKKSNPLKPIKKKYLSEHVTLPKILNRYNEVTERGYYLLSDGRRSDQMSTKEWKDYAKKVSGTIDNMILNGKIRFDVDGRETARAVHMAFLQKENILRDPERDDSLPFTWIKDTTQLDSLSKWDAFESDLAEYDLTPEELISEFPDIIAATIKEIEERDYFDISLADVPIEEWGNYDFPYGDLYDLDFFGYREEKDFEAASYNTGSRGQIFGVAVLKQNPSIKELPLNVDQEGNYFAPSTTVFEQSGIGAFFDESRNSSFFIGEAKRARSELIAGLYYALAYNWLLQEIMSYLKIDDFECCLTPESNLTGMINSLNRSYHNLRRLIELAQYGQDTKTRKLAILDEYFSPIDRKLFDIPEDIKEEVRAEIRNNFNFVYDADLQIRLFSMHPVKE